MPGVNISLNDPIVTNIERFGFWLLVEEQEFFVSFADYPEFENATVQQIHSFSYAYGHFHWVDLDVDIELDALKNPEKYPLKFQR